MPFSLGRFRLHELRDADLSLDGGAMFGIVPRTLWEKELPPDAQNRVRLAVRCLLIEDGARRILIDCGVGGDWPARDAERLGLQAPGQAFHDALRAAGCAPDDVTDLILTHLHLDHGGGLVRADASGELKLAFPNATVHLQRRNWAWAQTPSERDRASYRKERFLPLSGSGKLHLLEGPEELFPGISLVPSEGHTPGLQLVLVQDEGQGLLFASDVVPTAAHLRPSWLAAYDLHPMLALEEKKQLLAQALEEDWIVFFEHDPRFAACRLTERDGAVAVRETLSFQGA